MVCKIEVSGRAVTVVSYHAPPGVSWGIAKVDQADALRRFLQSAAGPVIVGMDANTPAVDHPDERRTRTHWHTGDPRLAGRRGDDALVGLDRSHRLSDALRVWLHAHPAQMSEVIVERPEGPLAVSHLIGPTRRPVRYDAVWVTDDLGVATVDYQFAPAVAAGTDHAAVVVDLHLRPVHRP